MATHALRLQETLLARLLAAQVNAAVDAAAARAAVPTAWDGGKAVLEAAERSRRSPTARLSAASGCAAVALALNRELAGMEARTLDAAQQAHEGKGSLALSPPFVGRLRCLQAGFWLCALSTLGFVLPQPGEGFAVHAAWLLLLAFVQGLGIDLLWCNLYIYLVERFPTTVRSTGFGVAMGLGRLGGIVSSAIGNLVPSMSFAFVLYAAAFAAGAVVALRPAVETARRSLMDTQAS